MKQLHYIFIFSFLYFQITLSQNKDTDKLLANIEHSDYQDSVRVQNLNKLCNLLSNYNTKKALNFGNQCLILARKLNFRKGEAEAFNNLGIAYDKIDLSKQAINYLFKANDKLFKQIWANYIKNKFAAAPKKEQTSQADLIEKGYLAAQPVKFSEKKGQMMDVNNKPLHFALFKAEIQGVNAYITEKGLTYVFEKAEEEEHHREKVILTDPEEDSMKLEMARVNLNLEGA